MVKEKLVVGCEEWCSFPELDLPVIKARIDSGAKTSSIHAFNIVVHEVDGKKIVKFDIHPLQKNRKIVRHCTAELIDERLVKSSSGEGEKRFVIKTPVKIGEDIWDIQLTLTNRDSMGYRMLLGREAMRGRVLVDPDHSFCCSKIDDTEALKLYGGHKLKDRKLRIVLLASNPGLYSNKRIMEAGRNLGHEMIFVNIREAYMNINAQKPTVIYKTDQVIENIDAVIPRIRPSLTFYGCALTRQFQSAGAFCLNDGSSIRMSRDKLHSLQKMAEKGIDMPVTAFASSPRDTKALIKNVGGAPLIVKLLEGTQGMGVVLAETPKAAESVINAFKSLKAQILVQEFIKEAQGIDIRCFVIDGKVVGSMQRKAAEGEFRANLHQGGTASSVKITATERKMAISAARIMGLKVAGVDIIRSSTGPKILEVNSSPGLEGIEKATGKDIASLMIEAIPA